MSEGTRLEVALRAVGFWPAGPEMVEQRTVEEWRGLVREVLPGLAGARLVALAWVAVVLGLDQRRAQEKRR